MGEVSSFCSDAPYDTKSDTMINLDILTEAGIGRIRVLLKSPFVRHLWSFIAPEKGLIIAFTGLTLGGGLLASVKVLLSIAMLQFFLSGDENMIIHVPLPDRWWAWLSEYGITPRFVGALVIAGALAAVTIFGILIDYLRRRRGVRMGALIARRVTDIMAKKVFSLRVDYFDKHRTGEVAYNITAPPNSVTGLVTSAIDAINTFVKFCFMYGTLVVISPLITAGISVMLLGVLFAALRLQRSLKPSSERLQEARRTASGEITEALSAIWLIKQFSNERRASPRIRKHVFRTSRRQIEYNDLLNFINTTMEGISSSIYLLSAFVIFVLYKLGHLTDVGFAIGYLIALMRVISEIRGAISLFSSAYNNVPVVSRMVDLMEDNAYLEPQPTGPEQPVDMSTMSELRLSGVSYEYNQGTPVLKDIDMTFAKGGLYAIVGLSGSGKTTALEILSGMRMPKSGAIEIDGKPVTAETLRSFRSQVGYGSQNPIIFQDSIRTNIGYGLIDPPQEVLEKAARGAGIHTFISELPNGYETELGVGGASISGGQKQRISLARVLAGLPQVVLLDEITSSLDVNAEVHIMQTLRELAKDRIFVLATHRLYSLRNFDWIYVMHEGQLVEAGHHDDLCQIDKGLYASLYNLQVHTVEKDLPVPEPSVEQPATEADEDKPLQTVVR